MAPHYPEMQPSPLFDLAMRRRRVAVSDERFDERSKGVAQATDDYGPVGSIGQ